MMTISGQRDHDGRHLERIGAPERADRQRRDAAHREHPVGRHRGADDRADLERERADERDQRVAERVPHDDAAFAQPLRARDDRVRLAERDEHRRADVAAVDADETERECERRQRHVLEPVDEAAGRRADQEDVRAGVSAASAARRRIDDAVWVPREPAPEEEGDQECRHRPRHVREDADADVGARRRASGRRPSRAPG